MSYHRFCGRAAPSGSHKPGEFGSIPNPATTVSDPPTCAELLEEAIAGVRRYALSGLDHDLELKAMIVWGLLADLRTPDAVARLERAVDSLAGGR